MSSEPRVEEPQRRQHIHAALILAGFTVLCYTPLLLRPDGLLHWPHGYNDAVKQYLGQRILVGQELAQGRLPRWDPHSFGGRPIIANPQTAVFYPGTWTFAPFPYPSTFSWNLVLHVFWFSLGVYVLSGLAPLGFPYRVCAGCLAAASLYLAGHILEGHLPHVSAATWFPWLLWAYERLQTHARLAPTIGWLAVFAALCLLAGHGQEAYYAALGLGLLYLVDLMRFLVAGRPRSAATVTVGAAGGAILAVAIAAVQLLPQIATLPSTVRGGQLALRDAWSFSSSLLNLVQLVFPFALGCYTHDNYSGPWNYWEGNLGLGLVATSLAVLGTAAHFRCRRVRKLTFLALFSVWFALGSEGRLFELLYAVVPGVGLFRAPGRMLFWFAAIAPILSSLGLAYVWDRIGPPSAKVRLRGLVVAAGGGVLLGLIWPVTCGAGIANLLGDWARGTTGSHSFVDALLLQAGLAGTIVLLALMIEAAPHLLGSPGSAAPLWRNAIPTAVTAGLFCGAMAGMHHLVHVVPPREAVPSSLARAVREAEQRCPVRPCRVLAASGQLPDTAAVVAGIEKLTGYDAFQLRSFATALSVQGTGDPSYLLRHYDRDPTAFPAVLWHNEYLDAWGVHFVVARRDWLATRLVDPGGWIPIPLPPRFGSDLVLLRRVHPVSRFRLLSAAAGEASTPGSTARLEVVPTDPRSGRWQFRVEALEPVRFVLALPRAPGMVVRLDGFPVAARTTVHGCMSIAIEPGVHRVDVEYRVPHFWAGAVLTAMGVVVAGALLISGRWRRGSRDCPPARA